MDGSEIMREAVDSPLFKHVACLTLCRVLQVGSANDLLAYRLKLYEVIFRKRKGLPILAKPRIFDNENDLLPLLPQFFVVD